MRRGAVFSKLLGCLLLLTAAARAQPQASYSIDTFAGLRVLGGTGTATEAILSQPSGVAVDGSGNLYIADAYNDRIRKVDSSGTITTVAGTGVSGFSGDGGSAVNAQLNFPYGVALDGAGNLYIADTANDRIRKVDSSGTITTVAGTGVSGFSGDGAAAVNAQLDLPYGVALDGSGNLYTADTYNHRIRKVDSSGTITTVAGTGVSGFSGDGAAAVNAQLYLPFGVALDGADNLYIADYINHRIRKVDSSGTITTFAGTGAIGSSGDGAAAVNAQLYSPFAVAVDGSGNLYIADSSNHRIRKVDSSGTITKIAGTVGGGFSGDGAAAVNAQINFPYGVALDGSGNLYIADSTNNRIRKVDSTGTITTVAGTGVGGFSGDGGPAVNAQLNFPYGVALDGAGNLYIVDAYNHRIRKVDSSGTITTVAGTGASGFSGDGAAAVNAQLNLPFGVALDGSGNLYIADTYNHRVRKVDSSGMITTFAGTGVGGFSGDGAAAVNAQLYRPHRVALDGTGNLYIADGDNHRIRKVDSTGTITTVAGRGSVGGFSGEALRRSMRSSTSLMVWRWTVRATSTSPIPSTTAFAGWANCSCRGRRRRNHRRRPKPRFRSAFSISVCADWRGGRPLR